MHISRESPPVRQSKIAYSVAAVQNDISRLVCRGQPPSLVLSCKFCRPVAEDAAGHHVLVERVLGLFVRHSRRFGFFRKVLFDFCTQSVALSGSALPRNYLRFQVGQILTSFKVDQATAIQLHVSHGHPRRKG
jgi:hypothetical protein